MAIGSRRRLANLAWFEWVVYSVISHFIGSSDEPPFQLDNFQPCQDSF